MSYNHPYWPSLDNPGEWNCYQVNTITAATLHPENGMIDVNGRAFKGNQYITLLKDPVFPFVAQVYSNDPTHNVPPTVIAPGSLYEAASEDGIGEFSSGVPFNAQIPPLVILPWNTTEGTIIDGKSKITSAASTTDFSYVTEVTFKGNRAPWGECVITSYYEPSNLRWINYIFAVGAPGKPRGLVSFWSASKDIKTGELIPELEYYAFATGKLGAGN